MQSIGVTSGTLNTNPISKNKEKYKQGHFLDQEGIELLDAPLSIPSLPHLLLL